MKLADILTPHMIFPHLQASSKKEAVREISECIAKQLPALSADDLTKILMEREKLGSTAIGEGVAIPHGKVLSLQGMLACFAKSEKGIDFDAADGQPTHLFFVLLASQQSAGVHLRALARISRMLRSEDFRHKLLLAHEQSELYQVILDEDDKV